MSENGNGNGKAPNQVWQWMVGLLGTLLAALASFAFLWDSLSAPLRKDIENIQGDLREWRAVQEKQADMRNAAIAENRISITRLDEARVEAEVQHAYRGVMSNFEATLSEMRSYYAGKCPGIDAYHRSYYPPHRLGKGVDQ
jgi:hypothetical protein